MIINHPVLNRFSPSIREIEPQLNDDKLVVPNVFSLQGLPPEPLFLTGVSTNAQESSFGTGTSQTIANGGPTTIQLATLRPGWWRIRSQGCYLANYTSVLQAGDMQITLGSPTQGFTLASLYAFAGAQYWDTEVEVLLQQNHTLSVLLNTNGVGQSHQVNSNILCNKLL